MISLFGQGLGRSIRGMATGRDGMKRKSLFGGLFSSRRQVLSGPPDAPCLPMKTAGSQLRHRPIFERCTGWPAARGIVIPGRTIGGFYRVRIPAETVGDAAGCGETSPDWADFAAEKRVSTLPENALRPALPR